MGLTEKQDGRPGIWMAQAFSTSPIVRQIHRTVGPAGQICDRSDLPHFQPDRNVRCCFQYYVYSESDRFKFGPMKWFSQQDWMSYEVPQSFADTVLLFNCWMEFNETWQEATPQLSLPNLCYWANRKSKMAALAFDWLRHFRLLSNCWMEFNETWLGASTHYPLASLSFSGKSLSACIPFQKEVLRYTIVALWASCHYWTLSDLFTLSCLWVQGIIAYAPTLLQLEILFAIIWHRWVKVQSLWVLHVLCTNIFNASRSRSWKLYIYCNLYIVLEASL